MRARLALLLLGFAGALLVAACASQRDAAGPDGSSVSQAGVASDAMVDPRLGGMTTAFQRQSDAFTFAARNSSREDDIVFAAAVDDFDRPFVPGAGGVDGAGRRGGLGPTFDGVGCASCHVNHGRGVRPDQVGAAAPSPGMAATTSGLVVRLAVPGVGPHGAANPHPTLGAQLQQQALDASGVEGRVRVVEEEVPGTYADGTPYVLRRVRYEIDGLPSGTAADGIVFAPRMAPLTVGVGLLEAVPEEAVLARADPDDRDGDGVRGRPNRVWDDLAGTSRLGRFGWKATQGSVAQQISGALREDMGVGADEIDRTLFERLVRYTQLVAPATGRRFDDPVVRAGASAFGSMGCSSCHTPTLTTGPSEVTALSGQVIHPFTDLLLHDMGPGLDDGYRSFDASGRDWRTPPLWGIGLTGVVTGPEAYLHDGRAGSLEEAILWHDGEGRAAREQFRHASREQREALVAYLRAL